jgi:Homing endonuclease associated repeat/HNH endonuclease
MTNLTPVVKVKYELDRLPEYSDAALLDEIRRVAAIVETAYVSKAEFDKQSRASSSAMVRRFGSWQQALAQAGLANRAQPVRVTSKMRKQPGKSTSREDLIRELMRVADIVGKDNVTYQSFNENSLNDAALVRQRFGGWNLGLKEAGLDVPAHARRYSEEECFENILRVWTHYGRAPRFREMNVPPSEVGGTAYTGRWGTFTRALLAFIQQAEVGSDVSSPVVAQASEPTANAGSDAAKKIVRDVSLGTRYMVLKRDRFKCVLCGDAPATRVDCQLHVDHIFPLARGGGNEISNLRTLCEGCNLGKGSRSE